jgi:peptidoglycan hydrolase-like protein with peptidoglycan-binding domain
MRRGTATLLMAVLAAAAIVLFGAAGGPIGALLGARAADAATTVKLPPTRLTALPNVVVNGSQGLAVGLSAPPAPSSPSPTLEPTVAGSWSIIGNAWVFKPASTLEPCSSYALTVWARTSSTGHAQLGAKRTAQVRVGCPPVAGLQQALARLGYIAARFRARYRVHIPRGRETRHEAAALAYDPPRGTLAPDPAGAPPAQLGQLDATTRGALEIFQQDNRLPVSGEVDSATWNTLLFDETVGKRIPQPYTWATVTETLPETLFLHRGHRVAFTTPVNTGVSGAETAQGIFPIYARYVSTTMAGEDPDGTKYDVSDVPWVNYFNGGDAVHGYPRESYGFPQSNGCVELPIEAAHTVFGMLAIGDIVWVQ